LRRRRRGRIVRESFRQHQAALNGIDVVVVNQPAAATASRQQLFDSLAVHWRRCTPDGAVKSAQE
jgi:ribonuclease P protein component